MPPPISVRLQDVGPIGFVRASTPISLRDLRQVILEQISDFLPADGFSFLVGGITISSAQEATEDYQEGDVFVVPLQASDTGQRSGSMRSPSVSLVKQFADAFGFMCAPALLLASCTPLPYVHCGHRCAQGRR